MTLQFLPVLQQNGVSFTAITDVGAVANAVAKVAELGLSPEGQLTIKGWREDAKTFNATVSSAFKSLVDGVGGWFK